MALLKKNYKPFILGIGFLLCSYPLRAQNFKKIYSADYVKAQQFIQQHPDISKTFEKANYEARQCWAIVFPELVRHSKMRDYIEITALRTLYVQFGTEYANFSVGSFQMKPSFIEQLETDAIRLLGKNQVSNLLGDKAVGTFEPQRRREIISRLEEPEGQAVYLVLFVKVVNKLYNLNKLEPADKVRFLATAYNSGYSRGKNYLFKKSKLKEYTTSTNLFPKGEYNYSKFAVYFYTRK